MSRKWSITLFVVAVSLLLVAAVSDPSKEAPGAQDPLDGSQWWVEDILQGGVIDNSRTTVHFAEPGRVAGSGGCNRYTGAYERDGASLSIGPLAGTRRACIPALMDQEQRFYQAMARVVAWRIGPETDLLHLLDENGETVIRASRIEDA